MYMDSLRRMVLESRRRALMSEIRSIKYYILAELRFYTWLMSLLGLRIFANRHINIGIRKNTILLYRR